MTAILTVGVIWCLLYHSISNVVLVILSIGFAGVLLWVGRGHSREGRVDIDYYVWKSRLYPVPPMLKFLLCTALMAISICSRHPMVGVQLAVLLVLLTVFVGGIRLDDYLHIVAIPVSFLLISGLALLWEYSIMKEGVVNLAVGGGYLCVTETARLRTALIMSRALGAVSCLYLLSLSTPMTEIIGVLKKLHCPDIMMELMYLIYRYIFLLFDIHRTMKNAAKSRLGFLDYPTGIRTTGRIYSNLLAYSYRQADRNFDAMESRCFEGSINFLEPVREWKVKYVVCALILAAVELAICLLFR